MHMLRIEMGLELALGSNKDYRTVSFKYLYKWLKGTRGARLRVFESVGLLVSWEVGMILLAQASDFEFNRE